MVSKTNKEKVEFVISDKNLSRDRKKIIEEAYTWLGTPYKYAKSEKGVGTDCSGLVMVVFKEVLDVNLPRNSAKQGEFCKEIDVKKLMPADLVFFATGNDPKVISHVGIFIGEDKFIHASSSKGVVISDLTSPYYKRTFVKSGKVIK